MRHTEYGQQKEADGGVNYGDKTCVAPGFLGVFNIDNYLGDDNMPCDRAEEDKLKAIMPNFALRRSDFTIKDGDVSDIAEKVGAAPKDALSALKRLRDRGYVVYKSVRFAHRRLRLTEGADNTAKRLYVAPLALRRLTGELELRIVSLLLGYQLTDCARVVRHSKEAEPLIVGSNVPASRIAAYFESGKTMEEIQEDFQDLMEDDFMDALRYYMHHRKEMKNILLHLPRAIRYG